MILLSMFIVFPRVLRGDVKNSDSFVGRSGQAGGALHADTQEILSESIY
jgi:hypothetical protein